MLVPFSHKTSNFILSLQTHVIPPTQPISHFLQGSSIARFVVYMTPHSFTMTLKTRAGSLVFRFLPQGWTFDVVIISLSFLINMLLIYLDVVEASIEECWITAF